MHKLISYTQSPLNQLVFFLNRQNPSISGYTKNQTKLGDESAVKCKLFQNNTFV